LTEEGSEDKPENPRTNKRSHSEEKEADVAKMCTLGLMSPTRNEIVANLPRCLH
jgi:hypothetical protein